MPPGPKKRKANKKKKEKEREKETMNPNPNSDPPPSTIHPLLHHQGNGHESHGSTDEEETMISYPDSTVHPQLERRSGIMVAEKVAVGSVQTEENLMAVGAQVENLEVEKDSVPEVSVEPVDAYAAHKKEVKIVPWTEEEEVTVNATEIGNKVFGSVEVEEDTVVVEKSNGLHEAQAGNLVAEEDSAKYFEVLVEPVVALSSHEKEVKIVPWQDEEIHIDVHEDLGYMVVEKSFRKNSDATEEFVHDVTENHGALLEEVNTFNVEYDVKEDYLKVFDSDEVTEESLFDVTENHNILVEEVDTKVNVGKVNELPHADEDLKETQLDTFSKEEYLLTEHPAFVTEEASQQSEVTAQNVNKILVGVVDSSSPEKDVKAIVLQDTARIEIAPRSEVARGPLVVRRATLWNCCGLFDVVTGSKS